MALNATVFWNDAVLKKPAPSWIPLLGGVFAAIGLVMLPYPRIRVFWWLPFLLDYGCVPGFAYTAYWYLFVRKDESPSN